jgi:TetR/AcrR family transcriptional regulator, regulator of cefoperazone and chloramphenicol sensitivity
LYMGREVLQTVRPRLVDSPEALDVMQQRLVYYALALVQAEQQRRLV